MPLRYGPARPASRRPFQAIAYQAKDDPVRGVARRARPKIAKTLVNAFATLRAAVPRAEIARKIAAGDQIAAADAVNIASFEHSLRPAFEPIADAYRMAMKLAPPQIASARVRKDSTTFSGQPQQPDQWAVDLYGEDVLAELRAYQDSLTKDLTDQMRQRVFALIMQGMRENAEPAVIADMIRDEIVLSPRLAAAVDNYRAALEQASSGALTRSLRNTAADAEVKSAVSEGIALSPDRIDELVDDYAQRALEYRADMIAQTESTRAANMGLEAAYQQMIDGGLPGAAVRKHWKVALDEKTCLTCITFAIAANVGIGIGEMFTIGEGNDVATPPVHPNCRCSIEIITNLDLVPSAQTLSEAA